MSERRGQESRNLGAGPSAAQRRAIRSLGREGVCEGEVELLAGCGWARVEDRERGLCAIVDRAGTVLLLEGPGRRRAIRRR